MNEWTTIAFCQGELGRTYGSPSLGEASDSRVTWPAVQPAAPKRFFLGAGALCFICLFLTILYWAPCGGVAAPCTLLNCLRWQSVASHLWSCLHITYPCR